jgi:hypothetical protein
MTSATQYPSHLNAAGVTHVTESLDKLGLDWGVAATVDAICDQNGFMGLQPGDEYAYEITNTQAKIAGVSGAGGYGVYAYIHIDADKHVVFANN